MGCAYNCLSYLNLMDHNYAREQCIHLPTTGLPASYIANVICNNSDNASIVNSKYLVSFDDRSGNFHTNIMGNIFTQIYYSLVRSQTNTTPVHILIKIYFTRLPINNEPCLGHSVILRLTNNGGIPRLHLLDPMLNTVTHIYGGDIDNWGVMEQYMILRKHHGMAIFVTNPSTTSQSGVSSTTRNANSISTEGILPGSSSSSSSSSSSPPPSRPAPQQQQAFWPAPQQQQQAFWPAPQQQQQAFWPAPPTRSGINTRDELLKCYKVRVTVSGNFSFLSGVYTNQSGNFFKSDNGNILSPTKDNDKYWIFNGRDYIIPDNQVQIEQIPNSGGKRISKRLIKIKKSRKTRKSRKIRKVKKSRKIRKNKKK
jgi:hypothetical protein